MILSCVQLILQYLEGIQEEIESRPNSATRGSTGVPLVQSSDLPQSFTSLPAQAFHRRFGGSGSVFPLVGACLVP